MLGPHEPSLPLNEKAVVGLEHVSFVRRVQDHRGRVLLDDFCVYVQRPIRITSVERADIVRCEQVRVQIAGHTSLDSVRVCAEGIRARSHREFPFEGC